MAWKRPESVLVVVHTRDGQVLVLQRADHPDLWQSVTGSLHWEDESPGQAAARELYEETGIQIEPGQLRDWHRTRTYELLPRWRHKYAPGVTENVEHFFSVAVNGLPGIRLSPREHLALLWMPWDAAAAKVFSWTNRAAIEDLARVSWQRAPAG